MTSTHKEAQRLLALDALQFSERINPEWDTERQLQHLREQIAMATRHLENEAGEQYVLIKSVTPAMIEAAEEAYMPFGDMETALNAAIAAAREVGQ
ncbi:hypothetical protein [Marinobacterium lutimaris]|uniref:Uncharacterized protein n=1 Tax=Marinobacterium lutimaris TaxID=568106 RepID=A0A1H5XPI5_9GAMM|nr:hypothetical protein [Marinobacterium lutimaris]SEG13668.1 hypothetical protein SAMN05444390_1011458 [Marinobacterium lutimaris]